MTVLIVGGGKMGMSHLALATQYLGKQNVALCDSKLSTRILFRLLGYQTFSTVDSAASKLAHLEGILIATPTPTHAQLVRWAITKNLPCFVEKPLTLDVEKSAELTELAADVGARVQIGFVMRYVASFQRLRQLVAHKDLGQLLGYTASMRGNFMTKPPADDSWQGSFAKGGGCLNEYGPHIIDLTQFIFSEVREVRSVQMERVYCSNADDRISFEFIHKDNTLGQIEVDWCDTSKRKSIVEFHVKFEHANVRADNSIVEIDWSDNARLCDEMRAKLDEPIQPYNVGYYLRGEEFSLELEEFLSTCIGRSFGVDDSLPSDTTARLKDGYEVDRLIDEVARKAGLK